MKKNIVLSILILLFTFTNFVNAKEFEKIASDKKTSNLKLPSTEQSIDTREDLNGVDFKKLFQEAENYFKLAKAWKQLKCEPKSGFICTKHECKRRDIKSTITLDKDKKTVTRCEEEKCEVFEAEFEQTGSFVNVQSKGAIGSIVRILGDSRYKEITTVGLDAYISNGNCNLVELDKNK